MLTTEIVVCVLIFTYAMTESLCFVKRPEKHHKVINLHAQMSEIRFNFSPLCFNM